MRDASSSFGPVERALLLVALDVRSSSALPLSAGVRWPAVLEVARSANIMPVLARRVLGADLHVPIAVADELRDALELTAVRNTRLLAELARLSSVLAAHGIGHLALKGAVLMARVYPSPALRHAVDLDVLVDPARFDEARRVLHQAGYHEPEYTQGLSFDGRSWARALDAPHFHASTPLQAPDGVVVDLHRRVPTTGFEASGGFAGWQARAVVAPLHGVPVPTAGDDDLTRHLCEHAALQNHADPLEVPRLLCDLSALHAGRPPWVRLGAGAGRRARAALALVRALHDAAFHAPPAPPPYIRALQRVAVADPLATRLLTQLAALRGHGARLAADLVHRPGFAAAKLLPARAYMVERFGVDRGSARLYALYARRLAAVVLPPLRRSA